MRKNVADSDSPAVNASSIQETVAKGSNTHGILNQHPVLSTSSSIPLFRVGVSIDRNKRWRRTMEDSHAFIYGYGGVKGQGFFSVFDGHAGKHAAEWCGENFHETQFGSSEVGRLFGSRKTGALKRLVLQTLSEASHQAEYDLSKGLSAPSAFILSAKNIQLTLSLSSNPTLPVPDVFAHAFHTVDDLLRDLAEKNGTSSGCTAVTAFLRLEDEKGKPLAGAGTGGVVKGFASGKRTTKGLAEEEKTKDKSEVTGGKEEKRKSSLRRMIGGSQSSPNNFGSSKDKEKEKERETEKEKEGILASLARRVRQASGTHSVEDLKNQTVEEVKEKEAVDDGHSKGISSSNSAPASTPQTITTEPPKDQSIVNPDEVPVKSPNNIQSTSASTGTGNGNSISETSTTSEISESKSSTDQSQSQIQTEEGDISTSSNLTNSSIETEGSESLLDVYQDLEGKEIRRVLYTANVGDARAVLCRAGRAVRLTYDHKGSDPQETKRITDSGGFVMNNRVNGVLAVTRSLGDSAMKEFVVGSPYTTETTLGKDDSFLIVACDGLWDVADDQDAVDLILEIKDPQVASEKLLQHALSNFSTDNISVMVIRLDQ